MKDHTFFSADQRNADLRAATRSIRDAFIGPSPQPQDTRRDRKAEPPAERPPSSDIQTVIDAWPTLAPGLRAAVLAIVQK